MNLFVFISFVNSEQQKKKNVYTPQRRCKMTINYKNTSPIIPGWNNHFITPMMTNGSPHNGHLSTRPSVDHKYRPWICHVWYFSLLFYLFLDFYAMLVVSRSISDGVELKTLYKTKYIQFGICIIHVRSLRRRHIHVHV